MTSPKAAARFLARFIAFLPGANMLYFKSFWCHAEGPAFFTVSVVAEKEPTNHTGSSMGGGQVRMSGAIAPGIIADLIRLSAGRRDRCGYLLVHSQTVDGRIWVKAGAVMAAECGADRNEAAIRRLLGLESGKFAFVDDQDVPERAIFKDTADILLECSGKAVDAAALSPPRPLDGAVTAIVEESRPGVAAIPVTEVRPLPQAPEPAADASSPPSEGAAEAAGRDQNAAGSAPKQHPPPPFLRAPSIYRPAAVPTAERMVWTASKAARSRRAFLVAVISLAAVGALVIIALAIRQPAPAPENTASGSETNAMAPASHPDGASEPAAEPAASRIPPGAAPSNLPATAADSGAAGDAASDFEYTDLPALSADWPDLHLSGLMITGEKKRMAVINGKVIQEGDEINGVAILSVTRTGILVRCSGETRFMPFKRSDVQRGGGRAQAPAGFSDLLRKLFGK